MVRGVPVNDDDDLDALLGGEALEEKAITEITNILKDSVDLFSDDWSLDDDDSHNNESFENTELISKCDRLQKELENLRSQHQFECGYVEQLEQEITSITTDRDRP